MINNQLPPPRIDNTIATCKAGPNDVSIVVWAIGNMFYLKVTNIVSYFLDVNAVLEPPSPPRHKWPIDVQCCLGPK